MSLCFGHHPEQASFHCSTSLELNLGDGSYVVEIAMRSSISISVRWRFLHLRYMDVFLKSEFPLDLLAYLGASLSLSSSLTVADALEAVCTNMLRSSLGARRLDEGEMT